MLKLIYGTIKCFAFYCCIVTMVFTAALSIFLCGSTTETFTDPIYRYCYYQVLDFVSETGTSSFLMGVRCSLRAKEHV